MRCTSSEFGSLVFSALVTRPLNGCCFGNNGLNRMVVRQDSCGREPAVKVEVWFNGHKAGNRERKLRIPVSFKAMAEVA